MDFNKKMFLSILMICFVGAAAAGTWASLSSEASTEDVDIAPGTIILAPGGVSSFSFAPSNIIPTESTIASLTVDNTGTRDGYLWITPAISNVPTALAPYLTVEYSADNKATWHTLTSGTAVGLGAVTPSDAAKTIYVKCSIGQDSTYNEGSAFNVKMTCKLNQYDNALNTAPVTPPTP